MPLRKTGFSESDPFNRFEDVVAVSVVAKIPNYSPLMEIALLLRHADRWQAGLLDRLIERRNAIILHLIQPFRNPI